MEVFLDCIPCILRQVLEASRMVTDNAHLQAIILEETLGILSDYKKYESSPEICGAAHQIVKRLTGISDPYQKIKERDIEAAKRAYPLLERFLVKKQNSLQWVLKIAATGNIIDSSINNNVNIEECIENELEKKFSICDIKPFEHRLKTAKNILIIGDNAGETVFDRVLAKHLAHLCVTYAVRSEPILNDATVKDAVDSGLGDYAKIIPTGCNTPGNVLAKCSTEFLDVFDKADIIISKGQGNYEALSDCGRKIFFLLKAKCPVISEKLQVGLNDYVFMYIE